MSILTCKEVKNLKVGEKVIFQFLPNWRVISKIEEIYFDNGDMILTFDNGFEFCLYSRLEDDTIAEDNSSSDGPIHLLKI